MTDNPLLSIIPTASQVDELFGEMLETRSAPKQIALAWAPLILISE
jgi:hypothetical protein